MTNWFPGFGESIDQAKVMQLIEKLGLQPLLNVATPHCPSETPKRREGEREEGKREGKKGEQQLIGGPSHLKIQNPDEYMFVCSATSKRTTVSRLMNVCASIPKALVQTQ